MTLTRRNLMLATASAAGLLAAPSILRAQTYELKVSNHLPPMHQINTELNRWAEEMRSLSEGALQLQVFPASQMGPPPRQADLVRTGVADVAFVYSAMNPGRFPVTEVFSLPFLMAEDGGTPMSAARASWVATSMRDAFAHEFADGEVLYCIGSVSGGYFMRSAQIRTPGDLRGLRVRPTTAIVSDQLQEMGASPANVGPAELADAIGRGVVDGAVFNFEGGRAFQLHQSVRQVATLASNAAVFALVANSQMLDRLPAELATLLRDSTGPETARRVGAMYDAAEAAGREFMVQNGVEIHDLTGDAIESFVATLEPVRSRYLAMLGSAGADPDALLARVERLKAEA